MSVIARKYLAETMKNLYNKNYLTVRDGNISFKPKNSDYFYITAGSVKKNEMNEEQILKIKMTSKQDLIYCYKNNLNYKPSREINIHSFLQMDEKYYNKDTFVVHVHPPNILSYIGVNNCIELDTIQDKFPEINAGKIGRNVKFFEAGTIELADNCYKNLLNNDIIGMERHGTLSIGEDMDKIIENIDTLEFYTNIVLKSNN